MDLHPLLIAAVSALSGATVKVVVEHVVQLVSPTARLKRAEAQAKRDAPPPPPPAPTFVIPSDLFVQAKQVEVMQLREELQLAQEALRRLRVENEELRMARSLGDALSRELKETQEALHRLRAGADTQAQELAALSAELQLARAHGMQLARENEKMRVEGPPIITRPERVLPEFKVERVQTRGGSSSPQKRESIKGEGNRHG